LVRDPDQFTLDRAVAICSALGSEPPVFTRSSVSSHTPFSGATLSCRLGDAGTFATVSAAAWEEIHRQPD
jgi:hypothetical protein